MTLQHAQMAFKTERKQVSTVEEIANLVQIFLCFQVTLQATSH